MAYIDQQRVEEVAKFIANLPDDSFGLDLLAPECFPPEGAYGVVEFLFAVTMHNYGFWYGNEEGWECSIRPVMNGVGVEDSRWLMMASMRIWRSYDRQFFNPPVLMNLTRERFKDWFSDDNGLVFLHDLEHRYLTTRAMARYFVERIAGGNRFFRPSDFVGKINRTDRPLANFLKLTQQLPGYNRDENFWKRNTLLAMMLAGRPEKFLWPAPDEIWPPIIDYHLMRVVLRLNLVVLEGKEKKIDFLKYVGPKVERRIRELCRDVMMRVVLLSGKPMFFVDNVFWSTGATICRRDSAECGKCPLNSVCPKNTGALDPVVWPRTTAY